MKRNCITLLCLIITTLTTYGQWSIPGTSTYTDNNNVEINNSDPDFVMRDTGNGTSSFLFSRAAVNKSGFVYDNVRNSFGMDGSHDQNNSTSDFEFRLGTGPDIYLRGTSEKFIYFDEGTTSKALIGHNGNHIFIRNFESDGDVRLGVRNSIDALTVEEGGEVGIGTTTPAAKLHINDGRMRIETLNTNCTLGNVSTSKATGVDFYDGSISLGGVLYSSGCVNFAGFAPNIVSLRNSNAGSTELRTDGGRLILRESGRVGINNTSPSFTLDVNGDGNFTGELTAASDVKLKKDIVSIDQAMKTVNKLNPVTYEFRNDEFPDLQLSTGQRWGLIAQEVEEILPDLVSQNESTTHVNGSKMNIKSVNYIDLIPVLIKALQEQDARIIQLEKQLAKE